MAKLIDILKEAGIVIPADKKELLETLEGFKDQETIDSAVIKAKEKEAKKFLKELGVETLDELKAKIAGEKKEEEKKPAEKDEVLKKIEELEKKLEATKTETAKKDLVEQQVALLAKKGFTQEQAKKILPNITQLVNEENDFEKALATIEKDEFYKPQFDVAAKQLKKGTIDLHENAGGGEIGKETLAQLDKIFGVKTK